MAQQTFASQNEQHWLEIIQCPGTQLAPLGEPVPQGSIHRLKMRQGTVIPVHAHPCDEYVYVIAGTVKTGETVCLAGDFWQTPANVRQGPHEAMTDVELLTVRLGPMGEFEN